jgi:hypothetical protein
MEAKVLSQLSTWSHGADLWILPDKKNSSWTKRLDWHLNFQIARMENRIAKEPSLELLNLLRKEEIPFEREEENVPSHLLIGTKGLLPTEKTLVLPYDSAQIWKENLLRVSKMQQVFSVRVFLPRNLTPEVFLDTSPELDRSLQFSLVPDYP